MSESRASVLIVDDDEDIRETVTLLLEADGHTVATAEDGEDALARLKEEPPPALILLDLMMPRMNGVQLLRVLRASPDLAPIPVVIFSGDTRATETASHLGADGLLLKPVDLDQLLSVVRQFTDQRRSPPPAAPT